MYVFGVAAVVAFVPASDGVSMLRLLLSMASMILFLLVRFRRVCRKCIRQSGSLAFFICLCNVLIAMCLTKIILHFAIPARYSRWPTLACRCRRYGGVFFLRLPGDAYVSIWHSSRRRPIGMFPPTEFNNNKVSFIVSLFSYSSKFI